MINITRHIKPLNKQACSPHGYKVNQTHGVSLREGALGYWSAGHALECFCPVAVAKCAICERRRMIVCGGWRHELQTTTEESVGLRFANHSLDGLQSN